MENEQSETLKPSGPPFLFPHHRRSHLKSGTFRALVRILSHCYDDSQRSHATCIDPEELKLDNVCNELRQGTGKDKLEEMAGPDGSEPHNMLIQEDTVVEVSSELIANQGSGSNQVQMTMDELEHIMSIESYEEPVQDNSTDNGVALGINQEDYFDMQKFLMGDSGNAEPVLLDSTHHSFKASKAFELSLDKDIISEVCEPDGNNEDKSSNLKINVLEEVGNEMQRKEVELEKSESTSGTMVSPLRMTADEEIEEGQIPDDFGVYDQLENVVALEENKVDTEQIFQDVCTKEVTFKEPKGANEKDIESIFYNVDIVDNANDSIYNESNSNVVKCKSKMAVHGKTMKDKNADGYKCIPEAGRNKSQDGGDKEGFNDPKACLDDLVFHGGILEENATDNRGSISTEKDAGVCNKKKRRRPSKEKKEKKKRKERMKRAEKNRQLGVKRLKLHPVLKPKTIRYCNHFLKGRCQKGNECSFSHDTVPLTKSTPCCHFARKSCMKGDDCPFDHQLAKYPCNNYVSIGSCYRGDNCMFSHKMPLKDGSPTASTVCKPDSKCSSFPGNSNFKKKLNIDCTSSQTVETLSSFKGVPPHKNTKRNIAETVLKPPAQAPKGISFLSFGNSLLSDSSMLKQAASSPEGDNVKVSSQMNQSASVTDQNLNDIPKRTPPALAPQVTNLLSLGRAPLDNCSSKKPATLLLNRGKGIDISPVDGSSKLKQAASSLKRDVGVKVGIQMEQSVSDKFHNMHEKSKRAPPVVAPPRMNSLSFHKAPTHNSNSKRQAGFPFKRDGVVKIPIQEEQSASDKLQNSSAMQWMLPISPLSSGQSSGKSSDGHKTTPGSAQKALLSTLAFAAKYESEMKMGRSVAAPAVRAEVHKESSSGSISGSSQNDSRKASTILDFIYGFSRTKQ